MNSSKSNKKLKNKIIQKPIIEKYFIKPDNNTIVIDRTNVEYYSNSNNLNLIRFKKSKNI